MRHGPYGVSYLMVLLLTTTCREVRVHWNNNAICAVQLIETMGSVQCKPMYTHYIISVAAIELSHLTSYCDLLQCFTKLHQGLKRLITSVLSTHHLETGGAL